MHGLNKLVSRRVAAALIVGSSTVGFGLAFGLSNGLGDTGTAGQITQTITAGSGSSTKTVTRVVRLQTPGVTGVTSVAAPPPEPAQMLPAGAQVPISPAVLDYNNGWIVSDGPVEMSVYAGSDATNPSTGMLVVVTDNLGQQNTRVVRLAGAGAVTLTGSTPGASFVPAAAPAYAESDPSVENIESAAAAEAEAESGSLQFTTADGPSGSLDLQASTVSQH